MDTRPRDDYLHIADDLRIRYRIDRPAGGERGSVLMLQGRAESVEKYEEVIAGLLERGLAVYAFDWRGQGLSSRLLPEPLKGHVESFEDYLHDLHRFVEDVWQPDGARYLIAHSMGAHLALRYLAERDYRVDGAVLCAPMIDLKTQRWPREIAPMIVGGMVNMGLADAYVPGSRPYLPTERKFENNPLTTDRERFDRFPALLRARPELTVGGPTFGWVRAAFDSIEVLRQSGYVGRIASPIHVMVGDSDVIVDLEAARRLTRHLPQGRFEVIENARHEIMLEHDAVRDRFWRAVEQWFGG
jgi:lysophospholipase